MKLITPVGTSLFTNYLDQNSGDSAFSFNYEAIKKCSASEWDDYDLEIESLTNSCLQFIKDFEASAELQSIAKIQDALDGDIEVRLLASDTIASRLAAEILADQAYSVLEENIQIQFDADTEVIKGLQVEDHKVFSNEGMTKLIRKIDEIAGGYWPTLAINITGGFKATLPYLTILAQLKRVPLYYNFEDTDALIKIPQAPLVIDWGLIERYSDVLWQIDDGIENWQAFQNQNHQAVQDLEAFIEVDGEDAHALLSPIGEIFWYEYQRYFVVELPGGSYYSYNSSDRQLIDKAIEELYKRLDTVLSDTTLLDADQNLNPDKYYQKIRDLRHNDDLNHTGQIPNLTRGSEREIFIFKSTSDAQIRLLYTFKVGKKKINNITNKISKNMITEIKIFDILCKNFDHSKYSEDWKKRFGSQNFPEINFVPRTFEIPPEILARRNQNVQTS